VTTALTGIISKPMPLPTRTNLEVIFHRIQVDDGVTQHGWLQNCPTRSQKMTWENVF